VAAIHVHDVGGRRVAAMEASAIGAGWHTWRFDGRDDAGDPLPSGLYFCTLTTAEGVRTVRMSRMR
jgi:flagellar hook assembly protein FlgD